MTDQDQYTIRTAGVIILCPVCNTPFEEYYLLKNHCSSKHSPDVTARLPEAI